jgi:hypothetical protein
MAFSGHKTRTIDRYSIVRDADLAEAADRLSAYVEGAKSRASVVPIGGASTRSR